MTDIIEHESVNKPLKINPKVFKVNKELCCEMVYLDTTYIRSIIHI